MTSKYARKIKKIEERVRRAGSRNLSKAYSLKILNEECPFCEYNFRCIYETYANSNGLSLRLCLVRSTVCGDVWLDIGENVRPEVNIGDVYGKLTVEEYGGYDNHGNPMWVCRCECGNTKRARGDNLINGNTSSCGCLRGGDRRSEEFQTRGIKTSSSEKKKKWSYNVGSVINPDGTAHHYPTESSSKYRQQVDVLVKIRDENDPYDPEKNKAFYEPMRCSECGGLLRYDNYDNIICELCGLVH